MPLRKFAFFFVLGVCASATALSAPPETHSQPGRSSHHGKATPSGLSINFLKPPEATRIQAGESYTVEVATEGFNTSGDHWHLYLDGELRAMVGAGRTSYLLTLPEDIAIGEHELKVTISNSDHEEYDLADYRTIVVVPGPTP